MTTMRMLVSNSAARSVLLLLQLLFFALAAASEHDPKDHSNSTAHHSDSTPHHSNSTTDRSHSTPHHSDSTPHHSDSTPHHSDPTPHHSDSTPHHSDPIPHHSNSTTDHSHSTPHHSNPTPHHSDPTPHHSNSTTHYSNSTIHHSNSTTDHIDSTTDHSDSTTDHSNSTTDHSLNSLGSNESTPVYVNPAYEKLHLYHRGFLSELDAQRFKTSPSILDFKFDKRRFRYLSPRGDIPVPNQGVVYWMVRDQRVQDNWALLYAQRLAIKEKVPLHVVFTRPSTKVKDYTYRQYEFMIEGLRELERECQTLNISFHFEIGNATDTLSDFVKTHKIGAIIVDFTVLREDLYRLIHVVETLGSEVPIMQVDAHNIIPSWLIADEEFFDVTIQLLMMSKLNSYLTEFPPVIEHPYTAANPKPRAIDWKAHLSDVQIDRSVKPVPAYKAGYLVAMMTLNTFLKEKLSMYHLNRADPMVDGTSNLSPWLRFGHISAQRVLFEVMKLNNTHIMGVQEFQDEIFSRREMFETYCYACPDYDSLEGALSWGRDTLNDHKNDTRTHVYTRNEFENALTNDYLWNAAHNQMRLEGKTHRYLRPYWAKKILEFSQTPEEAIATGNYLNNKYSLDANDPSGYGGILWAMTGLYDKENSEHPVFGKVRYYFTSTMRSKFESEMYILKYRNAVGSAV